MSIVHLSHLFSFLTFLWKYIFYMCRLALQSICIFLGTVKVDLCQMVHLCMKFLEMISFNHICRFRRRTFCLIWIRWEWSGATIASAEESSPTPTAPSSQPHFAVRWFVYRVSTHMCWGQFYQQSQHWLGS